MKINYWYKVIIAGCMCGVLNMGCKSMWRQNSHDENLKPETISGDIALGERFEQGEKITDVEFSPVYFTYDSFLIANSEVGKIAKMSSYMKRNTDIRLIIEGNCDERGSREYNMSLGEQRALAVRAYMIRLGIDKLRIQTKSYGEENPADLGHNKEAWNFNRRSEVAFYR